MADSIFDRIRTAIGDIDGASWDAHARTITVSPSARTRVDMVMGSLKCEALDDGSGYQTLGGTVIRLEKRPD